MQVQPEQPVAKRLLSWWDGNGRKDLPWQPQPRDAYRIWVAEIMLQQTQVSTVIPYYLAFLQRFPTLDRLADSPVDDVLALWSGLGYYQRARNLHRCAIECKNHYASRLPMQPAELVSLPGIGQSTANAIISQATDTVLAILDGNVKRWLARHDGISGWPGKSAVSQQLWECAADHLPATRGADYTQAAMDLGALVCKRGKPDCQNCPINSDCFALHNNQISELPGKKPKRDIPIKTVDFLFHQDARKILLERRAPSGIWGGLWCLPVLENVPANAVLKGEHHHQLSHFKMHIKLWQSASERHVMDSNCQWFEADQALQLGLPKPIRDVLQAIVHTQG